MMLAFYERLFIRGPINCYLKTLEQRNDQTVLDIGSGPAPYYDRFIRGTKILTDRAAGKGLDIVCDGQSLPLKDNVFDKILCINALYYFDHPLQAISEMHRLLKEKGEIILVLPFFYPIHDPPADKYRFTEYGIRTLLAGSFSVERMQTFGGIFALPGLLLYALIKGAPGKFAKEGLAWLFSPVFLLCLGIRCLDALDRTKRWPMLYFVVARRR